MRLRTALSAGLCLWSGGCSMFIQGMGQDLTPLKTREQVRQEFGTPIASGVTAEGDFYDSFKTRRKISDVNPLAGLRWMSLGLCELTDFPAEFYENGQRLVMGRTLRFRYDAEGRVTHLPTRWFEWPPVPGEGHIDPR